MQHLLVFRFSALGDVAICVPVIRLLLSQNPQLEITFVSRPPFKALFNGIKRLHYFEADVSGPYKGLRGLIKLFKVLKNLSTYHAIIDLHDALRSKFLRLLFQRSGVPVFSIDKGRKDKKALTRKNQKILKPLKSTVQRYVDVFSLAGYQVTLAPVPKNDNNRHELDLDNIKPDPGKKWIGLAPFAKHETKALPIETIRKLIQLIYRENNVDIFVFGAGQEEFLVIHELKKEFPKLWNMETLSLEKEMYLMEHLDVMVSMDSANMHLASVVGTPVVSIWGSTHYYAGFLGYGQKTENIVEIDTDELPCRPCSVYGNKPCWRKDHACLEWIKPEVILGKIKQNLS